MEKTQKQTFNVITLVYIALFVALHLVLTRVFVVELGAYRISLGSVATIMCGIWLGPLAGGVAGLASDLIGCFLKGYAVNPFITVAAVVWGVLPALCRPLYAKYGKKGKIAVMAVSIALTAILSSLVFTTAGLVLMLGYNFYAILPGRLVQFAIMTPIYCILSVLLYFSPLTAMVTNAVKGQRFRGKTV